MRQYLGRNCCDSLLAFCYKMLSGSSTGSENEENINLLLDRKIHHRRPVRQEKIIMPPEYCNNSPTLLEIFFAEFLGTAVLMFFGCMGLFGSASEFKTAVPMQGSLVFGFVVASVIVAIGHISGAHLNPAVTLCSYLLGNITILSAIVYFVAEVTGAVVGFWLLKESTPPKLFDAYVNNSCGFCNTVLDTDVSITRGFFMEFLATSFLIFIVCSIWDSRNAHNTDAAPIKLGLFITAASIAVGPFTGAGLNPARSFAPAVVNNIWNNHWIYWLAPLTGSLVTTLFYKNTFIRKCNLENKCLKNDQNLEP